MTKDELLRRVWDKVVVEENTLQAHISALRKGVMHTEQHMLVFVAHRGDRKLPGSNVRTTHRFDRVPDQVEDDLLKLDAISYKERHVVGKRALHAHPSFPELAARHRQCLPNSFVQVHGLGGVPAICEERTQPFDHLGGAVDVA